MRAGEEFFNLHAHDLLRVAVGTPAVRVADPAFNAEQTLGLMCEAPGPQLVCADVDLDRLGQDRMRQGTFAQTAERHREGLATFRTIAVPLELPREGRLLSIRTWERLPYAPADANRRDERCAEVYQIQVQGLAQRLQATGIRRVVIGVSGGLDST